jgi:hypothetical protein
MASKNGKADEVVLVIQEDLSGVGHCWVDVDADDRIRGEIEAEILDGGLTSCKDYLASNGVHYRW